MVNIRRGAFQLVLNTLVIVSPKPPSRLSATFVGWSSINHAQDISGTQRSTPSHQGMIQAPGFFVGDGGEPAWIVVSAIDNEDIYGNLM